MVRWLSARFGSPFPILAVKVRFFVSDGCERESERGTAMIEHLPLWPRYISEKGRTFGKTCGIKAKKLLGTLPLGNTLGTLGTHAQRE
jgi:hypothetical protein